MNAVSSNKPEVKFSGYMWLMNIACSARIRRFPARRVLERQLALRRAFGFETITEMISGNGYKPTIIPTTGTKKPSYFAEFTVNGEKCYGWGETVKDAYHDGYSIYRSKLSGKRNLDRANTNRRFYKSDLVLGKTKVFNPAYPSDILPSKHVRIIN